MIIDRAKVPANDQILYLDPYPDSHRRLLMITTYIHGALSNVLRLIDKKKDIPGHLQELI